MNLTFCRISGEPPYSGLGYFAIPRHFHADVGVSESLQAAKKLFERFIDIPYSQEEEGDGEEEEEDHDDDGRWRDIEAVHVNDVPDTPQRQHQQPFFLDHANTNNTTSSVMSNGVHDDGIAQLFKTEAQIVSVEESEIIGEAKIVHNLTATDLRSVMTKQQSQQQVQQSLSHSASHEQMTPPRPSSRANNITTNNENDSNSNGHSPPKRGLKRVSSMPLKAVNPTKQWVR